MTTEASNLPPVYFWCSCSLAALAGFFGGLFFDINGDYKLSFAFAGFIGVINFAILCLFYIRIKALRNQRILNLA